MPAENVSRRTAGEGSGHTARMYVPEESHSGILPMIQSNKDRKPSAENEEERPLIKENAGQPNTHLTQSGERVSQGLADVRKVARDNKEMKFTALLHHLTVDLLRESFYSLKRKAAPGVDGVTWHPVTTPKTSPGTPSRSNNHCQPRRPPQWTPSSNPVIGEPTANDKGMAAMKEAIAFARSS